MSVTKKKTGADELQVFFQAVADKTRVRLVNLLSDGEVCVCFFVEVLDEPQPKISRHLAYLRQAGLVRVRRDGKWAHYALTPPAHETVRRVFDEFIEAMKSDVSLRRDREALLRVCCSSKAPEQLKRAPRPSVATTL